MAENELNVFGMPTDTINTLQDNLHDRYYSGFPVLKELIQNANDARASVFQVFKYEGISNAVNPLLKKKAILVFNNGEVSEENIEGIKWVARGGKIGKPGVIGKFGLGMKSIFHFSDAFFLCAFVSGRTILQLVNPFYDRLDNKDPYHPDWVNFPKSDEDKLLPIISDFLRDKKTGKIPKDGLLLWIPLRDEQDKENATISESTYTLDTIWNQDSETLKKSIALSLVSLEISTPCIDTSRFLEKIEIFNQTPNIQLEYKRGSKTITSNGEEYCQVIQSDPINDNKGNELLSKIIKKNKFDKKFYTDEKLKRHEWSAYTDNQKIGLGIVKFINAKEKKIFINWCSYLPLDGSDDIGFYDDRLNAEYHIIAHANFSIDSGRRYIDGYNDWCINRENLVDEEFNSVIDNQSSQKEWNKILIRFFLLPNILKFSAEKGENVFFEALYNALSSYSSILGYFCFDKGIVFKNKGKWEFHNTNSIAESGLYLIKQTTEYYSELKNFANTECFKTTVQICNYIQNSEPGINWCISVAEKSLDNKDLIQINKIISKNNYPILLLPSELDKEYLNNTYRLSDAKLVIDFLEEFETVLEDKASDIFESICNNDSIPKEVSKEVFTNDRIKKYVKLFKVTSLDPNETKFNAEGKTFNEICTLSNNSQLFFYVAQNDSKQERELQPIYLLQRMCPNITFYCAGRATAKSQLFLKEDDKDSIYKYITEVDPENPSDEPQIKLLDSIKITSILYSMKQNLKNIIFGDVSIANRFLYKIVDLSEMEKTEYFNVLRSILLGTENEDTNNIYKLNSSLGQEERTEFFCKILNKCLTKYSGHIIRFGFDYPQSLITPLKISEKTDEDLEKELITIAYNIKNFSDEEKFLLSKYIYNEEVFKRLEIHKTVTGEFVSLDNTTYHCYLESSDENICFPSNYVFPEDFKLIQRNNEIAIQTCIKELTYDVLINTILLDEGNVLGNQDGIRLSDFICSLFEKARGKIKFDDICPNARQRKWIPDYSYHFYALDEVIDCSEINENLIGLCPGLINATKINENYNVCRDFFVKEKSFALAQLLNHPDLTSDNKWPWFNYQLFPVLKTDETAKDLLPYILKIEDTSIKIINEVLKDNKDEIIEALRNVSHYMSIQDDSKYISKKYLQSIIMLSKCFKTGDSISDDMLSLIEGMFFYINEEEILELIEQVKKDKDESDIKLPSESKTWIPISELSNFADVIPDLKQENTLSRRICRKFPIIEHRVGSNNNGKIILINELTEKIESCKYSKLWGVFCYLISDASSKQKISNNGMLMSKTIEDFLKTLHLSQILKSEIVLFKTEDNYCESLTSKLIKLKDAKEMDTIFYNAPSFDRGTIHVEIFDNFPAFSAMSIENALNQLFPILSSYIPENSFYNNLERPDQEDIKIVVNMIFATVFDTLKRLKLDTRAGENNQIATEYKNYMKACGERNPQAMSDSWDSIRDLIEKDSGGIQAKIRERVKDFIREAEYQERCILFELFQNADDAYEQKGLDSRINYFNVLTDNKTLLIEHNGRPINEYKTGGLPEYKSDLANMLIIGWSDKPHMNYNKQTGKFGYGFKTVYLISDEPHVISGEYDFTVKAALYPFSDPDKLKEYTKKTSISLPLNDNGLQKKNIIISEFENSAKFLVMFAKKIRKIEIDNKSPIIWNSKPKLELTNFVIESDEDILLFRTIPRTIQDPQCRYVSFAFKINGDIIIPLDEKTPKMWCLAPLFDFNGLSFAINADFKTNTGRQSLACENPDNKKIVDKISKLLIDAFFELRSDKTYGKYFDSLINILLDSKTKSKGFLAGFSEYAVQSCLDKNLLPTGTNEVVDYTKQNIYALSAHPFGSHIAIQYKYINAMNDFIKDCGERDFLVTTQIVADLIPEKYVNHIVEMKNIITLLDCLLNKYSNNLQKQKEILLTFKDSLLYNYVQEANEELSLCMIKSADGSIRMIKYVAEVSPDYGEATTILSSLYTPTKDTLRNHYQNQNNDDDFTEDDNSEDPEEIVSYVPRYTVQEVYDWWIEEKKSGRWLHDVEKYYDNKNFPSILSSGLKAHSFMYTPEELFKLPEGTIPKEWCQLLWIAAAQSMPYNWGNRDTSNRIGMRVLEEMGVFDDFCEGVNLQEIYNKYLDATKTDETRIRLFEMLLRIHKYRRNFADYYDLWKNLPNKMNDNIIQGFLVSSSDEELSGCGVQLAPGNRTFSIGYRLIIQNLSLCGFWDSISEENMKKLFRVFRGLNDSEVNIDGLPEVKEFYSCLDLPFLIYPGRIEQ